MIRVMKTNQESRVKSQELLISNLKPQTSSSQGFVSIFSVLIIMSILTLIAVGFSNVTRRAQQRVLSNQLNIQAYYAAESGVNEAIEKVKVAIAANTPYAKNTCQAPLDGYSYNNNLDAGLNVGYSCVLINNQDPKLVFTNVPLEGSSSAQTTTFKLSTGLAPKAFDVTWDQPGGGSRVIPNSTSLLPLATWNNIGIVRIDLIPLDLGLDRSTLATQGFSFFLYPTSSGSIPAGVQTVVNGPADQDGVAFIRCATAPCTAHMQLSPATAKVYKLRLQSIYAPVDVTISNGVDVNGTAGSWTDGQAVIDVTGKANDVFRRIQVRIPLNANGATPAYALQTADSICKRLAALPGNTTTDSVDNSCKAN
jgi:Tfp pilus assembly protein PilX